MRRARVWITLGWLVAAPSISYSATQVQIDQAWNKGVAWLMLNQHGDGGWSSALLEGNSVREGLGIQCTAAALEVLSGMGIKTGYTYLGGVSWLGNAEAASVDARARQVLALKASGKDIASYSASLMKSRNYNYYWGAYDKYGDSIIDTSLAMRAMLDINSAYTEAGYAVCRLIISQHAVAPDYGWSHIVPPAGSPAGQSGSAIAPTYNAVAALYRYGGLGFSGSCGTIPFNYSTIFNNTVTWLLTKKKADNGFGDTGTSAVLESAMALRTLKTVAPSNAATGTTIDYLIGQQSADGSWGAGNALQTAEVLAALSLASSVAGQRPSITIVNDTDKDGVPDGIETVMGTNPAVVDSRFLAGGSGSVVTQPTSLLAAASVISSPEAGSVATVDGVNGIAEAWDNTADVEVFIAGTSAQLPVLERALERLYQVGTEETLLDDGGVRGALSGALYRAYYGVNSQTGQRTLVHFSAKGGSESGSVAVARARALSRMGVDQSCVRSGAGIEWSCPLKNQIKQIPDAGLSEVQPSWYGGTSGTVSKRLTAAELARLDAKPINAMAFGVGATNALRGMGLDRIQREDLVRLMTAQVKTDWSEIHPGLPAQPILICRLSKGAQPAAEALLLGSGCKDTADVAAPASTNADSQLAAPGYLIVESETTDGVVDCLNHAEEGGVMQVDGKRIRVLPGSFAIGVLGAERVPQGIERWGYIGLDDAEPVRKALLAGEYTNYAEAWMQWRMRAVNGAPAVSGKRLTVLRTLRALLTDTLTYGDLQATAVLEGVPREMPSTRGGNVCSAPISGH